MQVLRSLPCFQQTSTKALKLLETEVQSGMTHLTVTNETEQSASWQRLTMNFLLLLGRMADNYLLERDAFLQKLAASHRVEGESDSRAVVHGPESPALEQPTKRHRPGTVCFGHAAFQPYHLLNFPPAPSPKCPDHLGSFLIANRVQTLPVRYILDSIHVAQSRFHMQHCCETPT